MSIGNRVTLLSGAVIGADGFGFGEHEGGLFKIPQVGTVVIEDDVEIGSNSTIDRATIGATILHRGVKLDDQVHIGHNCEIGEYTALLRVRGNRGFSENRQMVPVRRQCGMRGSCKHWRPRDGGGEIRYSY